MRWGVSKRMLKPAFEPSLGVINSLQRVIGESHLKMPAYNGSSHPFPLTFKYMLHCDDNLMSRAGKFAINLDPSTGRSECLVSHGAQLVL